MKQLVITKEGSPESYYLGSKIQVRYSSTITTAIEKSLYELKNNMEVESVILFGFPIGKKQIRYVEKLLTELREVNPEVEIEHYSTFGESLDVIGESYIEEDKSNIKQIMQIHPEMFITDEDIEGVELLQQYHIYDKPDEGYAEIFRALVSFYGEHLGNNLNEGNKSFIARNGVFVDYYYKNKNTYIESKKKQAKVFGLNNDTTLIVVFAEKFINELAYALMKNIETTKVIVLVGRPTQYSDMYSVRTIGVDAGKIAEIIGDGGGKENTGNFFLDSPYTGMLQSLVQYLNNNL